MSNTLQKRLNQLKPYVIGIRFPNELEVIDTYLKSGWTVPTSKVIQVGKTEDDPNYHMFYSDVPNVTLDDLMDFIEETIKINVEREKKYELLKVKVEELKQFFKINSLAKLQNMKFILNDNILPETITEDIFNSEFDLDMSDPVVQEVQEPLIVENNTPEVIGERDPDYDVQQFNNKFKNQEIELPPKKTKIEVETFEVPVSDGPCTHSPDTFCPKCMEDLDY